MSVSLTVDGVAVEISVEEGSLLDALREELGLRSAKDGCSPQGQCGCCTVLVDGAARAACVTPLRRVAGRTVTTLDGLDPQVRSRMIAAFTGAGASQCGFCTPGIIMRLAALAQPSSARAVQQALLAHLCRCTGWQTIVEAALVALDPSSAANEIPALSGQSGGRDEKLAGAQAVLEGGYSQRVGAAVVSGDGGFADDTAPRNALVAIPVDDGWVTEASLRQARVAAQGVQGRRSGTELSYPVDVPPGDWDLILQTTWVEPAYLEPDASWCYPGAEAASCLANGGAFGGKSDGYAGRSARQLADRYGRPVRVLIPREEVVRRRPKRPPMAAGLRLDGSGSVSFAATPGLTEAVVSAVPGVDRRSVVDRTAAAGARGTEGLGLLEFGEVEVNGPPTSVALRGVPWVEFAVLLAAATSLRTGQTRRSVSGPGSRGGKAVEASATADRRAPGPRAPGPRAAGFQAAAQVTSPVGSTAVAQVTVDPEGIPLAVEIEISSGAVIDSTVARSYAIGACHMALGWVCSEAIAVDTKGVVQDLTMRSFGILRARDMPPVELSWVDSDAPPRNGSDAVFAAVAAACWLAQGLPARWPTLRSRLG